MIERIQELDPERHNLAPRERYRSSRDLLQSVLERVNACGEGTETAAAQTEVSRQKRPASFSDATKENLGLARRLWAGRSPASGTPKDDPALTLLANSSASR